MNSSATLNSFAARLRDYIRLIADDAASHSTPTSVVAEGRFNQLALELFHLQFTHNAAYRTICGARKADWANIRDWREIPAVPTAAFKEFEMTCLPAADRTAVFHSSGTTGQQPSRHFHNADSLAVYEASLLPWFEAHLPPDFINRPGARASARFSVSTSGDNRTAIGFQTLKRRERRAPAAIDEPGFIIMSLTPPPEVAPHSSLVHMFATVCHQHGSQNSCFYGHIAADGSWALDFAKAMAALEHATRSDHPVALFGTAFNFVHLLDHLEATGRRFQLPAGSLALETGGYKGRSRNVGKSELHSLIACSFGVPPEAVVCEYGMSELSSQAYSRGFHSAQEERGCAQRASRSGPHDTADWKRNQTRRPIPPERRPARGAAAALETAQDLLRPRARGGVPSEPYDRSGVFHFPPWARAQIISPETGREVADGEAGLIRIFDLANVYSVLAIQTEDLGIRRGSGFELLGRAVLAEPRGCSLMAV